MKTKDQLTPLIGETEPKIVSDQNVAILARQLALHANVIQAKLQIILLLNNSVLVGFFGVNFGGQKTARSIRF